MLDARGEVMHRGFRPLPEPRASQA